MPYLSSFFCTVCDDVGNLTPKFPCWNKAPFHSRLSSVQRKCTSWLEKELPTTAKEADLTASATSEVADAEFFRLRTRIPNCLRHKKSMLLIKASGAKRPTGVWHESTGSSKNSTARATCLTACPIRKKSYPSGKYLQTCQDAPWELDSFPGRSADVNWRRAQRKYKLRELSRTTNTPNSGRWSGFSWLNQPIK